MDALHIRAEASAESRIVDTAAAGELVYVSGSYGPVAGPLVVDGMEWYQVQFISDWDGWPMYPPGTQNSWFGWVAARSGGHRYLELIPPRCPESDPDFAALKRMTQWEWLACFGDQSMTFQGTLGPGGGVSPGDYEPDWLASPVAGSRLFEDLTTADAGSLNIRVAPDSGG